MKALAADARIEQHSHACLAGFIENVLHDGLLRKSLSADLRTVGLARLFPKCGQKNYRNAPE
jgi:hypothetical protein